MYDNTSITDPLSQRARRLRNLVSYGWRHPSWVVEYGRQVLMRRRYFSKPTDYHESVAPRLTPGDALERILQLDTARFAELAARRAKPESQGGEFALLGGTQLHLDLLAAIVATMKPRVFVETGVARGLSSAVILSEMHRNACGHLHSLDLPVLSARPDFTGEAVSAELRSRWTLQLGPSRLNLAPTLQRLGTIDVFLHDADHLYSSQLREYRTAWPYLRPGGLLISDDVWVSPAFDSFALEVGREPIVVRGGDRKDATGILVK